MRPEPRWIDKQALVLLHAESLAEHGGLEGLRDEGLLESALGRPRNLFAYGDPDLADLAAAYGAGIAKSHPFADGNKRAAFLAIGMFVAVNGQRLVVEQAEAFQTMLALAAGDLEEAALAGWIRAHLRARG